ncbi:MAG: DUF4870 domain-containing protein [Caldilineaceae bacterium]|nr:DUF4870 domain-containing protein [Caldilineaceae bacterium]
MEHRKDEQQFEEGSPQRVPGEAEMGEIEAAGAGEEGEGIEGAEQIPSEEKEDSVEAEPTPAEQFADSARAQAGAAAGALRRGEFMHDSAVDPTADHDDRLIALLCYVTQVLIPLVMPVIVLLSASSTKRPFQRFHAVQSLALSLTFILFGLLMGIGSTIMALVPVIGWLVVSVVFCLSPLLALMGFLALAYYGYQAYQGKRFAIPGLTSFLQDQNWI